MKWWEEKQQVYLLENEEGTIIPPNSSISPIGHKDEAEINYLIQKFAWMDMVGGYKLPGHRSC